MPAIKRTEVEDERELEHLIMKKHLEDIEPKLTLIRNQIRTDSGPLDILCADNEGVLTILELKNEESDDMLIQSLRYLDWVNQNRDRIKEWSITKNIEIDDEEMPRIILIAPTFSDTIKKVINYVEPTVDLIEYICIDLDGEKGLVFREIEGKEVAKIPREPPSIESWLNRFIDDGMKNLCTKIIENVKALSPEIEARANESYFGFYYRNRLVGVVHTKRRFFHYVSAKGFGKQWAWKKITKVEEYNGEIENDAKEFISQLKK